MANLLKKAINNLAHALKGRRNTNGIKGMQALQKLDKLLNKTPEATTPRVTNPVDKPTPRVANQSNAPTPRVASQSNTPPPRVEVTAPSAKTKEIPPERAKMRQLICAAINNRARIPQQHQMNLCQSQRKEQAQLIHDKETGEFLIYRKLLRDPRHKETWERSAVNKFGQLAQGLKDGRVKGTNTIFFISKDRVPKEIAKNVAYGSFSCDLKPNKTETHRTRLTTGGDRVNYPGDAGTPTADMILFKILLNSIISTKGARCVMVDIKDFYLCTPMKRFEYMRLKITNVHKEIIREYGLHELVTPDGYIYCKIQKGCMAYPKRVS
jgi:hypothetical protein